MRMLGAARTGLAWAARYAHLIRHLHMSQIYHRLLFRFWRPTPDVRPPPPVRRPGPGAWREPAAREQGMLGPDRFRFLSREHTLAFPRAWTDASLGRRWLFDLHFFHYLNAEDCRGGLAWHYPIIADWVRDNPPAEGVGWHPYPLSLRVVNWIKWALAGNRLPDPAVHSLAVQARFLSRRLERDLLGNHLISNAKALVYVGLFFEGEEAERWLERGLRILADQIPVQILADGGHYERSPMYHSIVLEDLLDVLNVLRKFGRESRFVWTEQLSAMRSWLQAMCHPDGQLALFNDTALNVAVPPHQLERYAARLGVPAAAARRSGSVELPDSGFARVEAGPAIVFLNIGSMGPDILPGHCHADTLSFELSLAGRRMVVDSGISTYDECEERLRQRGTGAHNTVVIDGRDSSDVWRAFKVGRRARVADVTVARSPSGVAIGAAHDGYCHLAGAGRHRRTWQASPSGLLLTDELEGTGRHRAEVRFHLHPAVRLRPEGDRRFRLTAGSTAQATVLIMDEQLWTSVADTTYHPGFGRAIPNRAVVGRWEGEHPVRFVNRFEWG